MNAPPLSEPTLSERVSSPSDAAQASCETTQYEFDDHQDKVIGELAQSMRWIAVTLMVLGVLYIIAFVTCVVQAFLHPQMFFAAIYVGLAMTFFLAVANWTRRASAAFEQIVHTEGQDVTHLMAGLDNLRKKYSLLSLVVKVYIAVVVFAVLLTVGSLAIGWMSG